MWIDSLLEFSDNQDVTSTAVSTNIVNLQVARQIGNGRVIYVVVTFETALSGTSPTLDIDLETDDNEAFSSATTVASFKQFTDSNEGGTAGQMVWIAVPNTGVEQFLRLNYTAGGTVSTGDVNAFLTDQEPFDHTSYADAAN